MDEEFAYTWIDGQSQGFKIRADAASQLGAQADTQAIDVDRPVNYDCDSWNVDSSLFNTPSGVVFTDLSGFIQAQ
jgi:hypothetical protein